MATVAGTINLTGCNYQLQYDLFRSLNPLVNKRNIVNVIAAKRPLIATSKAGESKLLFIKYFPNTGTIPHKITMMSSAIKEIIFFLFM